MEPVDAAAEVMAWALAGGLVLLAIVQLRHWLRSDSIRPTSSRIPARELELLGEDWTVHTEGFVRKWSKRQAIVDEVCRGN